MPRPNMVAAPEFERTPTAGYIKPKNLKAGTEISAIYKGTFMGKGYEGDKPQPAHRLELVTDITLPVQKNADSPLEQKTFKAGQLIVLNSAGSLDKNIVKYPLETDMDISYEGKKAVQIKGKTVRVHQFKIYTVPGTPTLVAMSTNDESADENSAGDNDF